MSEITCHGKRRERKGGKPAVLRDGRGIDAGELKNPVVREI